MICLSFIVGCMLKLLELRVQHAAGMETMAKLEEKARGM